MASGAPRIQVFRPTMEEFRNFSKYIEKVESSGAHKAGLAKIIPPEGWHPRKKGYDDIEMAIPAPISQVVTGRQGLYQQINIQQKSMSVKEFKKLAESNKYKTPPHFDYEDLERKYWKNITYNSPIYGADVSGSLYEDGIDEFNIQHLNTILDMVKEDYEIQIEGVNTAYLYFGMWKTTFAWHTEDMDLYSINYLHFGAPKSWYVVPPEHGRRLERLASGFFHGSFQSCPAFLRHKMTIISPQILKQYSIPYSKITQEPGEFMITFPFGYHSGFNHGFNCAESTNFALPRWVEYGKRTLSCSCRNDCVKICMDMFVKKFQPERYELWKLGKDYGVHPEDPNRHYFAPAPNKIELARSAQREEKKKAKMNHLSQKLKRHPITRLEKLERKQALLAAKCQQSELVEQSDSEDTQMYDIDEAILNKNHSSHKKSRKKSNESEKMSASSNESLIDEPMVEKPCDELVLKKELIENPPELTPFWDSEGKVFKEPTESDVKCTSQVDTPSDDNDNKAINIFEQYPIFKEAVSCGQISLYKVDSEAPNIKSIGSLNDRNNDFSSSLFSKNWKCEQTQGLKIRFVQPKKENSQEFLSSTVTSQTVTCNLKQENMNPLELCASNDFKDERVEASTSSDSAVFAKDVLESSNLDKIKVKRAANSFGNWALPLQNLWQHQTFDFEAECRFNGKFSRKAPHCAICIIFSTMDTSTFESSDPFDMPPHSTVKMPAFCYGNDLNNACLLDTNPLLSADGSSPLLTCSTCKICVHATCYGVTMLQMGQWYCNRCTKYSKLEVNCCLCVLRGGALKPTNDGRWVHVICAILIQETYFENLQIKQPVNISYLTPNRQRLKCKYCFKSSSKDIKGACVQCQSGKCYLPFHVTCGYMAGVIFETSDWPEPVKMICTRHAGARRKPVKRQLSNIEVGEKVLAKHKNKRYYWVIVKNKYIQDYYSVLFEDNSHSTNTLPEDVVSRNVNIEGPPEMNEKIQVKWTDDKIYNCTFKGSQSCEIFVVEFDDGSVLHQERQQIYAENEEVPKEVRSRMGHSSERKSSILSHTSTNGKRLRVSNAKYSPE